MKKRNVQPAKSGIIPAEYESLSEYFTTIKVQMGLGGYDITFEVDEDMDDAWASINICDYRRLATLRWSPTILSAPPNTQRMVCVHECLHIILNPLYSFAADAHTGMSPDTGNLYAKVLHQHDERVVDELAVLISESYPLPTRKKNKGGAAID